MDVEGVPLESIASGEVASFILGIPQGRLLAIEGMTARTLRVRLDRVGPGAQRGRAIYVPLAAVTTAGAMIAQVLDVLARAAFEIWPVWFGEEGFAEYRNDTLGRLATGIRARDAATRILGLSPSWAEAAARLVLNERLPRVPGLPEGSEIQYLARTICPEGLVLVFDAADIEDAATHASVLVDGLEWISRHLPGIVVVLFARLPPNEPPFDRLMHGARRVMPNGAGDPDDPELADVDGAGVDSRESEGAWLAPARGNPHPLSEIEQRLAKILLGDAELGPLFGFNRPVTTVRGTRPKVDLLWPEGRLVVECDGFSDHGTRGAFLRDRHRDYELMLSGYMVLRLANDEVTQDYQKAVEKIRDLVRLRRAQFPQEG
ncbi:endonuclease domain-containing protein [Roseixanthobacter pseudopolyaromaticivorans]|uniref:endonuclease domain-containing protein n=1 Tax=Xanthobacteraceae TaxID=335928 RepID=UPI0037291D17